MWSDQDQEEHAFWPLPLDLAGAELVVEVRGNPAGLVADRGLGAARLALRELAASRPTLAAGEAVALELALASGEGDGGGGTLSVELRLQPVGVVDAAVGVGIPRAAAQTCVALLAKPSAGIYLDVKSAYSVRRGGAKEYLDTPTPPPLPLPARSPAPTSSSSSPRCAGWASTRARCAASSRSSSRWTASVTRSSSSMALAG